MGLELKTTKRTCSIDLDLELETAKGRCINGIIKLKTVKGIYTNDMTKGHFSIDCFCSDAYKKFESKINGFKHTYYKEECKFLSILESKHKEKNRQKPLVIKCKKCKKQKFPFTDESYYKLQTRMVEEYNKQKSN